MARLLLSLSLPLLSHRHRPVRESAFLVGHIGEQIRHRFAVVRPSHRLREHHRHIDALDLRAVAHMAVLRYRVRHHHRLEARIVDARNRRPREDAVRQNGVHLRRAGLHQLLGRMADRSARVGHVIDQNRDAILHVAHQHHRGDLVRLLALLVDQRKLNVQPIGDRRDALGAARIRRHDDRVAPLGNVLLDPLEDGRLSVQIVDGYVEEALRTNV